MNACVAKQMLLETDDAKMNYVTILFDSNQFRFVSSCMHPLRMSIQNSNKFSQHFIEASRSFLLQTFLRNSDILPA